jgi:outer membrane protein OmpA-like peptidoglycan-associated protein
MIGKIFGLAVCIAAVAYPAVAQEVGIELNGGMQGAPYTKQSGESKVLPGGSVGVSYLFRVSRQWGLLSGVTGGVYRTQASLPDGRFIYNRVDDVGSAFQYDVKISGYKETQQFFAASIPLLLQYHTAGKGGQWFFEGGGKVFLPLNASVKVSAEQLSLTGYYPNYDIVISNLPAHGFGTVNGYKGSTTTQLKPSAALSAATGFSFGVSPGMRLYLGVYVDYGLTGLRKKSDSLPLVTYSSGGIGKVQANGVMNMRNSGQPKLLAFGLAVRLSFGGGRGKAAAQRRKDTVGVANQPAANQRVATPPAANQPIMRQLPVAAALTRREEETVQRPVAFGDLGSSDLSADQKSALDEVVDILKSHPDVRISVVGHTCNDVKDKEDIKVGEARAKAVAAYLQSKGINRRRMDVSYFRDSDPVQLYNPAANARSRRVVVMVE